MGQNPETPVGHMPVQEYRSQEESRFLEMGMLEAGLGNRFVPIRRDSLLFDGFDRLNAMGERLKGRVRIAFIDAHGVPEAGVVSSVG